MTQFHTLMTLDFDALLTTREAELCALLAARDAAPQDAAGSQGDVSDFKDAASGEALAAVDAAQAEHAAIELEQVLAARRRLRDHEYGVCLDCGEPISVERLQAMPATAYCASCQSDREHREAAVYRH